MNAVRKNFEGFAPKKTGTGAVWDVEQFANRPTFEQVRDSNMRVQNIVTPPRTISEHIANILRVVSPSVTELGTILKVTRQAIYKWKNGECELDADNADRVRRLSQIAHRFSLANVANPMPLLKAKVFAGHSALELFQQDHLNDNQISMLIKEGTAMQQTYKNASAVNSRARASEDWRATISLPGRLEKA
jgi:hypothetical protein